MLAAFRPREAELLVWIDNVQVVNMKVLGPMHAEVSLCPSWRATACWRHHFERILVFLFALFSCFVDVTTNTKLVETYFCQYITVVVSDREAQRLTSQRAFKLGRVSLLKFKTYFSVQVRGMCKEQDLQEPKLVVSNYGHIKLFILHIQARALMSLLLHVTKPNKMLHVIMVRKL